MGGVPTTRRRRPLIWTLRAAVACAIALSSGGLLYGVSRAVGQARELAERSLESTAVSLAASLERALRSAGPEEAQAVLSDRVVAYAQLASSQGRVLLHTNPDLVGTTLPAAEVSKWLAPGTRRRPHGLVQVYRLDAILLLPGVAQQAELVLRLPGA